MKLKEIIVENTINEVGIGDVTASNVATARKNFENNFKKQVKLNTTKWGMRNKKIDRSEVIHQLANSYMKKYGVSSNAINNPKTQQLIAKASANTSFLNPAMDELIDRMYLLASTTVQAHANDHPSFGAGASTAGATQPKAGTEQLNPTTKQIVNNIKKYTGASNLDDLTRIAKTAMQVLYKQNPTKYTELYKEITSGQTKKPEPGAGAFGQMASNLTQPEQENPNIIRGTNESKRK